MSFSMLIEGSSCEGVSCEGALVENAECRMIWKRNGTWKTGVTAEYITVYILFTVHVLLLGAARRHRHKERALVVLP